MLATMAKCVRRLLGSGGFNNGYPLTRRHIAHNTSHGIYDRNRLASLCLHIENISTLIFNFCAVDLIY